MTESGLLSAGGPLPLTQAVPGNISTGPCGPGGAPYGRTEYGRSRRSRGRSPAAVKGLTVGEHLSEGIDLGDRSIPLVGVNEMPCLRPRGVNRGIGMGQWLLHVPRVCVRGPIQALTCSCNPYWPLY